MKNIYSKKEKILEGNRIYAKIAKMIKRQTYGNILSRNDRLETQFCYFYMYLWIVFWFYFETGAWVGKRIATRYNVCFLNNKDSYDNKYKNSLEILVKLW